MMSMCYWVNSRYWSSQALARNTSSADVVIRVADFQQVNWVGFNFCKYHKQAVEIFQILPNSEKFFCELKPNRCASFKVWCVDEIHFENLISKLNNYADIELEFIISNPHQIPELFQPLNLTFYERSIREQRKQGMQGKKAFKTSKTKEEKNSLLETLAPPSTLAPPAFFSGGGGC